MRTLEGLTVVMTGAAGGIGSAAAMQIAKPGVRLAICGKSEEKLAALADRLSAAGAEVFARAADVTRPEQIEDFMEAAYRRFGRLDILVNFAGLSVTARTEELSEADYDRVMDVNVKGMFFAVKSFAARSDPERGGLIVNFGSMAAKRANPGAPHYSAAKAAVNLFSEGLARQLKSRNIRVTVVNPGPTDTDFFAGRIPPEKRTDFLRPEDVAELLEFIMTRDDRVIFHDVMFESFGFFQR